MHRVIAVVIIALAVALAVAYRVWTVDESEAPATATEAASPEIVDVSTVAEQEIEASPPEAPAIPAQTAASLDSVETPPIQGIVVEQESRRPVPGATVTAYDAIDWFESADSIEMLDDASFKTALWNIPEESRSRLGDGATGADGRFSMTVTFGDETYLECTAPGYATAYLRVQESSDPASLRITLQRSGRVSGRVTDADTGQAIAGATVSLSPNGIAMERAMGRRDAGPQRNLETETDLEGRYELNIVLVGSFLLTVDAQSEGYISQAGNAPVLNIEAGVDLENADVQLNRGGFVFGDLSDRDGEPVVSASFSVTPKAESEAGNVIDINANAIGSWSEVDDDGAFRLGVLEYSVDYQLKVSNAEYAPVTQEIRLKPGSDAGPLSIVFGPGASISGMARYVSGDAATGERLMLRGENDTVFSRGSGSAQFSETGDDGTFTFEHVPDGVYAIFSSATMGLREDQRVVAEILDGRDVTGIEITIEESADDTPRPITGLVVDLNGDPVAGIPVSGLQMGEINVGSTKTDADGRFSVTLVPMVGGDSFTLEAKGEAGFKRLTDVRWGADVLMKLGPYARVLGVVVNQRGDPIADCAVSLKSGGQGVMAMMQSGTGNNAVTTDDGRFEIAKVKPGAYFVSAESQTQGAGKSRSIEISEGRTVEGIRIILEPGARISGRVLDPDRRPVANAQVRLMSDDTKGLAAMGVDVSNQFSGAATTDDRGEFSIPNMKPGIYTVTATHDEFVKATRPDLTLKSGDDVLNFDFMLSTGGGASGVYMVDGRPVSGTTIFLSGAGGSRSLTTDAEGRFDVTGMPGGWYMAQAVDLNSTDTSNTNALGGYSTANMRAVEIVDGQIVDIDFTPPDGVDVSGSVASLGLEGDAMVRLRMPDGRPINELDPSDPFAMNLEMINDSAGFGTVRADGTFNVENVEPGRYVLEVYVAPDPNAIDISGDVTADIMRAFLPVLMYSQGITVGEVPIQITVGAPVP